MNIDGLKVPAQGKPIYSSDQILARYLNNEMWGSLTHPCKEQYGDRDGELFTCLNPDKNHSHIALVDNTPDNILTIFPACIESKEFLVDILNALVQKRLITAEVKAIFLKQEASRLSIEKMTVSETAIRVSAEDFAHATLAVYIPLNMPD